MTPFRKLVLIILTSVVAAAGLCACDRRDGTPGQQLDKALDKTGDKVKQAGEAIKPR